jgi:arginine repressor
LKSPNAPAEIGELLKKKTRTNRLINVNLILVLGRKKKLSQSELVEQMKNLGIEYSQPAIEKYLSDLELAGILESKKAYKKE